MTSRFRTALWNINAPTPHILQRMRTRRAHCTPGVYAQGEVLTIKKIYSDVRASDVIFADGRPGFVFWEDLEVIDD